ncbi:Chaperone protein HtpG [Pelotomaculum schinkii]|uniref:Chaperone protein HtpG n=1 Tax=Pelotomaculum schinkii TaxID=78350 RepID=A0A4Y7R5V8_9FIRM|nr:ATP-binding protein [Pelotomaculum schinkii]TEB04354.1 Chaperone protein HtpG [Pelotomaculum schinkii]
MQEYVFGANIIENLTTGMYQDSKVIYREYIQNSCDQIDKAVAEGLLREGEGKIEIWLDFSQRTISIEDNATGIPASEFERTLGNIADSDKQIGKDKGFRGIGRLCGLAPLQGACVYILGKGRRHYFDYALRRRDDAPTD